MCCTSLFAVCYSLQPQIEPRGQPCKLLVGRQRESRRDGKCRGCQARTVPWMVDSDLSAAGRVRCTPRRKDLAGSVSQLATSSDRGAASKAAASVILQVAARILGGRDKVQRLARPDRGSETTLRQLPLLSCPAYIWLRAWSALGDREGVLHLSLQIDPPHPTFLDATWWSTDLPSGTNDSSDPAGSLYSTGSLS